MKKQVLDLPSDISKEHILLLEEFDNLISLSMDHINIKRLDEGFCSFVDGIAIMLDVSDDYSLSVEKDDLVKKFNYLAIAKKNIIENLKNERAWHNPIILKISK